MSSTNRGTRREEKDYYVTPIASIVDFLTEFERDRRPEVLDLPGRQLTILDPSAGGDDDHLASYPSAIRKFEPWRGSKIRTIDIRQDSRARSHADYLTFKVKYPPWIVMTNPPFHLAVKFITKALTDVRPGGLVIMLFRLNFFGSQGRKTWWHNNMPLLAYIHSKRMGFKRDSKETDSIEYAHLVWKRGVSPRFTKLRVI